MEDVEAAVEGGGGGVKGRGRRRGVRVAEEHEDVPDAQLGGEGDGVVEEGEVPAGAVGGGGDVVLVLLRIHFISKGPKGYVLCIGRDSPTS